MSKDRFSHAMPKTNQQSDLEILVDIRTSFIILAREVNIDEFGKKL